jgi:hypothetical protein
MTMRVDETGKQRASAKIDQLRLRALCCTTSTRLPTAMIFPPRSVTASARTLYSSRSNTRFNSTDGGTATLPLRPLFIRHLVIGKT